MEKFDLLEAVAQNSLQRLAQFNQLLSVDRLKQDICSALDRYLVDNRFKTLFETFLQRNSARNDEREVQRGPKDESSLERHAIIQNRPWEIGKINLKDFPALAKSIDTTNHYLLEMAKFLDPQDDKNDESGHYVTSTAMLRQQESFEQDVADCSKKIESLERLATEANRFSPEVDSAVQLTSLNSRLCTLRATWVDINVKIQTKNAYPSHTQSPRQLRKKNPGSTLSLSCQGPRASSEEIPIRQSSRGATSAPNAGPSGSDENLNGVGHSDASSKCSTNTKKRKKKGVSNGRARKKAVDGIGSTAMSVTTVGKKTKKLTGSLGKPFHCQYCTYSTHKPYLLKRHMRRHSDERPHLCTHPGCPKAFKTGFSLQNHTHDGVKPCACPFAGCEAAFVTSGELVRHKRYKHTGEKPHKCHHPHCEYSSVEKSKLDRHIRSHTGERPYECSHCGYAFGDSHKLKRHLRVHTGEKPYECDICHHRFTQSSSMKAHRLVVHDASPPVFPCLMCPQKCHRKNDLKIHVQRIHHRKRPVVCTTQQ